MENKNNGKISLESSVLDFIKSKETVKVKEIGRYFNISGERAVRRIVESLREKGEPICISPLGYYYSTDPSEIEKTIRQLLLQANGQLRTAKHLKLAKEKIETLAQ